MNLESLEFRPEELDFMAGLAPLLDRSPRALKRFVNVYRLIKAGLTREEQRTFYDAADDAPPPYQAVLFLLAVDTGLPEVAEGFFDELHPRWPDGRRGIVEGGPSTLAAFLKVDANRMSFGGDSGQYRWPQILAWTRMGGEGEPRFDAPLALLAAWEWRVTRFSFRANA